MVSSKDVAKQAKVSQATVSRVLNTPEKVKKNTRNKVLNVIEELNYRPNSIARSLVNKKTQSIALISGPLHNSFFAETTTSIVNHAKSKGYNVNVHFEDIHHNSSIYKDVFNNKVDGIILSSIYYEDKIYEELKKQDVPFIMFNRRHKQLGNYVEMNNFQAGQMAANHLLDLNHKDIVWIGGSLSVTTFLERHEGFKYALKQRRIALEEKNLITTDTSSENIFFEIERIISRKNTPSAIFAATDSIAIYIIDILRRKGYSVPEDISIIGVDNVKLSRHSSFSLSTVGTVSNDNLGKRAIRHLINLIEENNKELGVIQETIKTNLFIRDTTRRL